MKCYQCSAELTDDAQFCPECGAHQGFTPELIERAKSNDQYTLTELYNKTYSNVYYTVKALIKDDDAALDILQDSYIKAFKSLDQLKEAEKFRAWIKRIAHNRAVDYLRAHKPVLFTQMEGDDNDEPIEFEDTNIENLPEEVIDRDETSRLMREILDSLPEEQRAVLSMFYYEQLSVGKIAAELGVSEGTVKSRLNYGRKKVEAKVLDLEKKGTKLYGLAPIPFLLLLFRIQASHAAPVAPAVCEEIITASAGTSVATTTAAATGSTAAGTVVGKGAVAAVKHTLAGKIMAGALAVAAIGAGVTGVVIANHKDPPAEVAQATEVSMFDPVKEDLKADVNDLFMEHGNEVNGFWMGDWVDSADINRAFFHDDLLSATFGSVDHVYRLKGKEDFYTDQFYITASGTAHYDGKDYPITGIYYVPGLSIGADNKAIYNSDDEFRITDTHYYKDETEAYEKTFTPLSDMYDVEEYTLD